MLYSGTERNTTPRPIVLVYTYYEADSAFHRLIWIIPNLPDLQKLEYVKERYGLDVYPFWRGIFGMFFCHSLFMTVYSDEKARSIECPHRGMGENPSPLGEDFSRLAVL
jgi:hypothetical protein